MTSLKLCEQRMNCHVRNMIWLPQRSQAKFRIILLCLLITAVESMQPMTCKNLSCSQHLQKSLRLTKLVSSNTEELLQIYKASQGDSADLICDMQMENVPISTISGQSPSERILSVYTRLKEFLPHLKTVKEQQKDLEPSINPVTERLISTIARVGHMATRVNCLLQIRQPNIPIPEPADRSTGIPPAQNIFQQKAYGCIVLLRLQELLSHAFSELKSLRGKKCREKTQ